MVSTRLNEMVLSLYFSADGKRLVSGCQHSVKVLYVESGKEMAAFYSLGTRAVALNSDGSRIAVAHGDSNLSVIDPAAREFTVAAHLTGNCLTFSPDSSRFASDEWDGHFRIRDARTGRELASLSKIGPAFTSAEFSPDGKSVAIGELNGTIRILEAATVRESLRIKGHDGATFAVAYAPDGRTLATAGADAVLRLWDVTTGEERATLTGHKGPVRAVAWSPDGKLLVSGGDDKTARVWEASSGRTDRTLEGHEGGVRCVAWGKEIATGGADGMAGIWDPSTGGRRLTLGVSPAARDGKRYGFVTKIAFAEKGRRLLTVAQGTIRLWDAAEGHPLLNIPSRMTGTASLSPDDRVLVSPGVGGGLAVQSPFP